MAAQPLAYESLKTVLQYMEPNLRFKLANCIPSIAPTEKAVPLKIKRLTFSPYEFVVNGTSYKLTTYRHYPPDVEALRGHQDDNSKGGVPYDLDQYGFVDYSQEDIETPGNVVILENKRRREPYTEVHARRLESQLEVYEWMKAKKLGHEVEPLDSNRRDYFLVRDCQCYSIEQFQMEIDRLEAYLAPAICRRNNTGHPYSTMVQFTLTCPKKKEDISRKSGGTKLYEAQDKLATCLFGNRNATVSVKHFEVKFLRQETSRMAIRLPPGFKIKVREMTVLNNSATICDAVRSLVCNSSYPLEQFRVLNSNVYSLKHPTISNAKKLLLGHYSYFLRGIAEFLPFPNKQIFMGRSRFTPNEHVTLLRTWIANRREVGTCFVSQIEEETTITEIFEKCREELHGYNSAKKRSIKIPMSESSEIEVSYKSLKKKEERTGQWMLTIKVVAV